MHGKRDQRTIARERIQILFKHALELCQLNSERAQKYVYLARTLGMRYKVPIPREYRGMICPGCKRLMVPGINAKVRLRQRREPHIVTTCLQCGKLNRMPIRRVISWPMG